MVNIMRDVTVCFSGHRPEKFPFEGAEKSVFISQIKSMLHLQIYEALLKGYTRFISGMARGVDLWACEIVLGLKQEFPQIELICAIPYEGYASRWFGVDKLAYNNYIHKAEEVHIISESYNKACMRKRNVFMVDNSSLLIAVCGDPRSGTGQTIRYARKQGVEVKLIRTSDEEI
ncbi:MAG: DUF1273 domain-containing protein [Clostridiales bacterium]|nr:DUF1273 domain-containing protein [Clostridiales bacterium]